MTIKNYIKSVPITDEESGELDITKTNVVLTAYPIEGQEQTEILWEFPFLIDGPINLDLVDIPDEQVGNFITAPDYPLIGNDEGSGYTDPEQINLSVISKYYKTIDPEFLKKIPQYSIKESYVYKRHDIDIMQNVLRTVTEVRDLDAERIPLLSEVVSSVVKAFEAVATYKGGQPAPPMNAILTPEIIQPISDSLQAYTDKDQEMRDLLTELTTEVKTFINGPEK